MISFIDTLASVTSRLMLWLGALLLLMMAFHITADVVLRYLFSTPIAATLEFGTYYYMVAASFLALGYAQMRDHNISVDILVYSAPSHVRMAVESLALAISFIYAVVFTYGSFLSALDKTKKGSFTLTQHFDLLLWPSRWILVASGTVFALVLLAQLLRLLSALMRNEDRKISELIGMQKGAH